MGMCAPSHTCLACGDSIHLCLYVYGRHIPGFCGRASSFILCLPPTHWLLATLGWSVIHFREPLHSNYQRGVRGKVSSWDRAAHAALCSSMEYFKLGEAISSWRIINYTCCGFPLGSSSDTLEYTSPDVVFYQRGTACGAGISADTWLNVFSKRCASGEKRLSTPTLLTTSVFFSIVWFKLNTVFPHYFPHHLNRSWQQVWAKHNKKKVTDERG